MGQEGNNIKSSVSDDDINISIRNEHKYQELIKLKIKLAKCRPNNIILKQSILLDLGKTYLSFYNYLNASQCFEHIIKMDKTKASLKDYTVLNNNLIAAHFYIGIVQYNLGEYLSACDHFKLFLNIQDETSPGTNSTHKVEALYKIGVICMSYKECGTPIQYFTQALDAKEELSPGQSTRWKSLIYKGMTLCDNSKKAAQNLQKLLDEIKLLYCNGVKEHTWSNIENAQGYYSKALDIIKCCKSRETDSIKVNILNNLGALYIDMGKISKGIEYYRKAIEFITENPHLQSTFSIKETHEKIDLFTNDHHKTTTQEYCKPEDQSAKFTGETGDSFNDPPA